MKVPNLPALGDPAAVHKAKFLSLFQNSQQREAWSKVWTYQGDYSQNQIDLPFPYPADSAGRLELNDAEPLVRGLRAMGAEAEARGCLENWLALGERYTALPGATDLASLGRSAPPKLSRLLLEEAKRHEDPEFLGRAYRVISDDYQHNWSDTYFKQLSNGLNRYCDVDYSHDATLEEAGGAKNAVRFDGDPQKFCPIDLNADLYRTERDLAEMARRLGKGEQADQWEARAAQRKEKILSTMWDDHKGFFFDLSLPSGQRSEVKTMAAYAVIEAGLLDPDVPVEAGMQKRMLEHLPEFDGRWELTGNTPADPADMVLMARDLERRGAGAAAEQLVGWAGKAPTSQSSRGLAAQAMLAKARLDRADEGLEDWCSPKGMHRLRQLFALSGGEGTPRVAISQVGRIDRHLCQMHQSMFQPALVRDLKERGLLSRVFGLEFSHQMAALEKPQTGEMHPLDGSLQVGPASLEVGIKGAKVAEVAPGAFVLESGGASLFVTTSKDHLILGDRAYSMDLFPDGKVKLPRDIVASFYTAGNNPQLEQFYHVNRDWISSPLGPASTVGGYAGRPDWTKLYGTIADNWPALTIEPSVTPHDTAVQYFNPAAVPSVGIFKTQFNWDTMFMAKGMQLQGQESLVASMTDNLLYLLKSTGRVPNAARSVYLNKSQPPFLPSLVRMSEPIRTRQFGEASTQRWVKEAYEVMAGDFRDFWREEGGRAVGEINGQPTALSRWGGPNHKFAMDESGFDTTSRFNDKTKDLVPPDLNAFLWGYAKDMEVIALRLRDQAQKAGNHVEVLRYSSEASYWQNESSRIKSDVIKYCWDEQDGMFRDYRFEGEPKGLAKEEDALSAVVAPLWVGMLDPKVPEEQRMIERSLDNIGRFEKEHGLAATAEDYGHPEMQWNGPSGWAPLHMMAIESEVRFGRHEEAARHTAKWLDTISRVQQRDGLILERYDVVKGDHPPIQKGRYEETQGEGPG
ncbi:MAG: hypothetical protein KC910_23420, partial [Candidatus Eremiobacteraeota bacterium]|nr:hypothetical protein [Candidatus Eremiobacteraeota bacterium]